MSKEENKLSKKERDILRFRRRIENSAKLTDIVGLVRELSREGRLKYLREYPEILKAVVSRLLPSAGEKILHRKLAKASLVAEAEEFSEEEMLVMNFKNAVSNPGVTGNIALSRILYEEIQKAISEGRMPKGAIDDRLYEYNLQQSEKPEVAMEMVKKAKEFY